MQKVVTQMKRNQLVDPDTGRVDLRYNPMSVEEDYLFLCAVVRVLELKTSPAVLSPETLTM